MMQFSLISLIPGLIRNLQDCADPELDSYEKGLSKPTSLKTSDRSSLLSYMGLPLQIFGKVRHVIFPPLRSFIIIRSILFRKMPEILFCFYTDDIRGVYLDHTRLFNN